MSEQNQKCPIQQALVPNHSGIVLMLAPLRAVFQGHLVSERCDLWRCEGEKCPRYRLWVTILDWTGLETAGRRLLRYSFRVHGWVPATVMSDNLRSGITKACFYEPAVNRTYAKMATHA
jgi:hypothetical protein